MTCFKFMPGILSPAKRCLIPPTYGHTPDPVVAEPEPPKPAKPKKVAKKRAKKKAPPRPEELAEAPKEEPQVDPAAEAEKRARAAHPLPITSKDPCDSDALDVLRAGRRGTFFQERQYALVHLRWMRQPRGVQRIGDDPRRSRVALCRQC